MNSVLRILLRAGSDIYVEFRKLLWSLSFRDKHLLRVLKDKKYYFTHFGDITRILYTKQHLVNAKKSFEYDTLELYQNNINKGATIIDIGANVGLFSLLGSELIGPNGKVLAIEPSKQVFDCFNKNIELNNLKNIIAVNVALGEEEGFISMSYPNKKDKEKNDAYGFIDTSKVGDVKCVVLDQFIKKHDIAKIDVIKIDVEGAELLCLKGAKEILKRDKPVIIFEAFEPYCKRFGYQLYDLLAFLKNYGYSLEQIDYAQWIAK